MERSETLFGPLVRLGFAEPEKAEHLLADPALAKLFAGCRVASWQRPGTSPAIEPARPPGRSGASGLVEPEAPAVDLPELLSRAADPDLALLALVRLAEAVQDAPRGSDTDAASLREVLLEAGDAAVRLVAVLGGSRALAEHLAVHPGQWRCAADATQPTAAELREALVAAVQPDVRGERSAADALRVGYRAQLLRIAALDLSVEDPVGHLPVAAESLAELAEAALEAALSIAREEFGEGHEACRLAIIGMGKTGGGELNYVSDVDVIFVAEPAEGYDEQTALRVGTALATATMRACSSSTAEGTLWPVDPALRPEGKQGPLVRTIASHRAYYERWAKTWEFQALLKAYVAAGDLEVGKAYKKAIYPMVWEAAARENFVEDVQAMRRRVEQHVPAAEAPRQLKLGPGGLRDVEFSVQLLQLVHGRHDPTLRSATTLEALAALARGGYVGREDAAALDEAYRLLRTLEHRIQLYRLRRTHVMPTAEEDLRWLGRAVGLRHDPARDVVEHWQFHARTVRRIHEQLFYRPLLAAVARLRSTDASLSPQQARERLAALGFRDPGGALRHLEALTNGVSRRAAIQRTLLPVMLGWFADEADPDAGLLAFRRVSDHLGSVPWFLKMLRDEGRSAELLAHALARSRYVADLLARSPESVAILGDVSGLEPRDCESLASTFRNAALRNREDPEQAMGIIAGLRRFELLRIAFADLAGVLDLAQVGVALADVTTAVLDAVLTLAISQLAAEHDGELGVDMLLVGMGSLGGLEMGYASDADVIFVHQPRAGVADDVAQRRAVAVVQEVLRLLGIMGQDTLSLDADLRPEGKNGPMSRSVNAFRSYYERWAQTWEFQALLRARPIAGDPTLGHVYLDLVDPLRWPARGITPAQVRDIRMMKARVESERLPRGADPKTHLKLGRGGLADVEWTVQLLQLQHAHRVPALRSTNTLAALDAAEREGLLPAEDASCLRDAWQLAASLRNAAVLWRGRPADALPTDVRDADGIGRIIGREPATGSMLSQYYLRVARRARAATEATFYTDPR